MPFVVALQASAGTLGMIIPPSTVMIILGVTGNISIGKMFLGGFIPGGLLGLSYMGLMYYHAKKHGYPSLPRTPLKECFRRFLVAIPSLCTIVIILLGLALGVFSATEAGVAATVYAMVLSFIYKELKLSDLLPLLIETGRTSGMVMLIVATASLFGWVMTILRLPEALTNLLPASTSPAYVFFMINILLVLVGTFLDPTPLIIILLPLLMPIIHKLGIDPVHFGVVFSVNMLIAQISPPAGVPLFVAAGIADCPVAKVFLPTVPFIIVSFAVLMLITYVPWLVLIIPNLVMK
jgi:C4-dicarboxylate transporter DctM subunit